MFIALVLSHGGLFLGYQAGTAVIVDAVWVVVFAAHLFATRRSIQSKAAATLERV